MPDRKVLSRCSNPLTDRGPRNVARGANACVPNTLSAPLSGTCGVARSTSPTRVRFADESTDNPPRSPSPNHLAGSLTTHVLCNSDGRLAYGTEWQVGRRRMSFSTSETGAPSLLARANDQAHQPGGDTSHDTHKPASAGKQLTWSGRLHLDVGRSSVNAPLMRRSHSAFAHPETGKSSSLPSGSSTWSTS